MQKITLPQVADILESATIDHTHHAGFHITHIGKNAAGAAFAMIIDAEGSAVISVAP